VAERSQKDHVLIRVIPVIKFVVNLINVATIVVKRYVMRVIVVYARDNFPDFVIVERKSLFDHVGRK